MGDDRWATGREMNPLEAMMWRAEVDPRLRSNVLVVGILDRTPDWGRLVAAHDWASRVAPRLRQRVVEPSFGLGMPAWAVEGDLDLSRHLRRTTVPAPGGRRALLDLAQEIAATPFDRTRPLWEAVLVEGLADGRAAYVIKMHHTLADGLGMVQLLALLRGRTREHDSGKAQFPAPEPDAPSRGGLLVLQAARRVLGLPADVVSAAGTVVSTALRGLVSPRETVGGAAAYVASALRLARPPSVPGAAALGARSDASTFTSFRVPLADLKAAAKAGGGSLNDAFLTALLGGYRLYLERFGPVPTEIPMGMPVSLRRGDHEPGGNHWAGTRLVVPVAEVDPARRIARVGRAVQAVVDEPVADGIGLIAPLLAVLPPPLLARIQGGATSANDLQASNVRGLAEDVYLAGAELVELYAFAPRPGCAAMVTLVSHGDTCYLAVTLDPAAVIDPQLFTRCLRDGFDEVLALGRR